MKIKFLTLFLLVLVGKFLSCSHSDFNQLLGKSEKFSPSTEISCYYKEALVFIQYSDHGKRHVSKKTQDLVMFYLLTRKLLIPRACKVILVSVPENPDIRITSNNCEIAFSVDGKKLEFLNSQCYKDNVGQTVG
jgi:hypothetical protein